MEQLFPNEILRVPAGATEQQLRRAYRRLAMKYHPDRNPGDPGAEDEFKRVQWAYEELMKGRGVRERHDRAGYPMEHYIVFQNPTILSWASLQP